MAITAFEAAKKMCDISNWSITNLRLQKLLYLAHKNHIQTYNKPLITRNFEAWKYGPVLPVVYERCKVFYTRPVLDTFYGVPLIDGNEEADSIKDTFQQYRSTTTQELVNITHLENGAWDRTINEFGLYAPIKNEYINLYDK